MNEYIIFGLAVGGGALALLYLHDIRRAVEASAEIAKSEKKARAGHYAEKIRRKEEERKERKFHSATRVVWEIQKLLLAEGLDLRLENINPKEDGQGYFIFQGEVENKGYCLKIHILPVGSAAKIFAERFGASVTPESSKFIFPQDKEIIGKTIAHWEHQ